MKDYRELLKDKRWIEKRNKILTRDKNTCQFCGCQHRYLHVHHKKYEKDKMPWEYDDENLITLCDSCHEMETEMNGQTYLSYKELRDKMKEKGFSMTLLDNLLSYISDALTRKDNDECATDSTAYHYVYDVICGTQIISDIFAAKRCGFDLRPLIQCCYPQLLDEYDKI